MKKKTLIRWVDRSSMNGAVFDFSYLSWLIGQRSYQSKKELQYFFKNKNYSLPIKIKITIEEVK